MQQYFTLEEAAKKLNMSPDELREMAKSKKIRAFQDRGSWRFRTQDVEELARSRGADSGPELKVGEAKPKAKPKPADDDALAVDFTLDDKPASRSGSGSKSGGPRSPKPRAGDSDVKLVMDSNVNFELEDDPKVSPSPKPRSGRKGKTQPGAGDSGVRLTEKPSDSDVKVVPAANDSDVKPRPGKSPSDSDIRLQDAEDGGKKKKGEASVVTEEVIDLDAEEASASKSMPKPGAKGPRVTQTASSPALPTESPFELSESEFALDDEEDEAPAPSKRKKGAGKKGVEDSSSDFEVVAFDASKSPGDLGSGEIPLLAGDEEVGLGDLAPAAAGNSGINLDDPADSGISLEDEGVSEEVEFELTLDSGATPKPAKPGKPAAAAKQGDEDSSSEFELSVDDDSSSEFELSLDDDAPSDTSSSEFELSLDDSGEASADDSASDSEFELTLDDEGGLAVDDEAGFESTNFDVPALDDDEESDSASEAMVIDDSETETSGDDFEISLEDAESDSESQVVAIDDSEADEDAPTIARPRPAALPKGKAKGKAKSAPVVVAEDEDEGSLDFDLDEDSSATKKKGKKGKAVAVVEDDDDEESEEETPTATAPEAPAEWGSAPALMLLPTVLVLFLVCFMGYELIQGMFGFQRPAKASKPVVDMIARPVAEAMDMQLPDSAPAK